MGFWKNDVPDIIALKKDEQGLITIEHSQGVFTMHESEVKDISYISDQHSEVISSISLKLLIYTLAFLILGGVHNVLCQFYIENVLDKDSGLIVGGILIVLEYLTLIFLLNKNKFCFNGFFRQKKDVIIFRNNSMFFKFRFRNSDKIKEGFLLNMEDFELQSIRLNWFWIGLLAIWIFCSFYYWTKIPFWFGGSRDPIHLNKCYSWLGFLGCKEYFQYRNSEIGLIKLLIDGTISNFCLISLVLMGTLILTYVFFLFYIPLFFCHCILNSLIPWNEKKVKFFNPNESEMSIIAGYSFLSLIFMLASFGFLDMMGLHGTFLKDSINILFENINYFIPKFLSISLVFIFAMFSAFFPFYACVYIVAFKSSKYKSKS